MYSTRKYTRKKRASLAAVRFGIRKNKTFHREARPAVGGCAPPITQRGLARRPRSSVRVHWYRIIKQTNISAQNESQWHGRACRDNTAVIRKKQDKISKSNRMLHATTYCLNPQLYRLLFLPPPPFTYYGTRFEFTTQRRHVNVVQYPPETTDRE